MATFKKIGLIGAAGALLAAGTAMAQAPDWREPQPAPAPAQPAPQVRVVRAAGAIGALGLMLPTEDASLAAANTDNGVEILITSDKPEQVAALQVAVERQVAAIAQMAARLGEWRAAHPTARLETMGLMVLLLEPEVAVSTRRLDNGSALCLTSKLPETVKKLQEKAPEIVAAAQRAQNVARRRVEAALALKFLASERIRMEVTPEGNGVAVRITSDDPQVARRIKELLPRYVESLKAWAEAVEATPGVDAIAVSVTATPGALAEPGPAGQ